MEMGLTNVISAGSTMTNAVLGSGKPDSVSTFGSILRLGGSLLIVLGVLLAVVWLLRQWQRIAAKTGPLASLRLIESRSLGSKQALYLSPKLQVPLRLQRPHPTQQQTVDRQSPRPLLTLSFAPSPAPREHPSCFYAQLLRRTAGFPNSFTHSLPSNLTGSK